jgi:signal transduction histidine kinase
MPATRPPEAAPGVWTITRTALATASPRVRRLLSRVAVFWIAMVALQIWDSRNGQGASGLAEFLSALLGICGIGLLAIAGTLQLAMQDAAAARTHSTSGITRVLLALPAVGFAAGVALGAATLLMIVRATLGAELPFAIAGALLYGGLIVVAARTVTESAQSLFTFAAAEAKAAAEYRGAATAARLDALQARMNPHVLFNALNTVASLVRSNPPAAERVVETLADVMRQTLDRSAGAEGTVAEEVRYVRACLGLDAERWGEHLRVDWTVDDGVLDWPMPPFVVQPLVENALRHGVGSRVDGGRIQIAIRADGDGLQATVQDDGPGFRVNWREGHGLGGLRQRLHTIYGDAASLTVAAAGAGGSSVTVRLPKRPAMPTGAAHGG